MLDLDTQFYNTKWNDFRVNDGVQIVARTRPKSKMQRQKKRKYEKHLRAHRCPRIFVRNIWNVHIAEFLKLEYVRHFADKDPLKPTTGLLCTLVPVYYDDDYWSRT